MLNYYTRFFNHLYTHNDSIRKAVGKDVGKLVAILRDQPDISAKNLNIEFEKYFLKLLKFAQMESIEPWFYEFLEGQHMIEMPMKDNKIVLTKPPSNFKLTAKNIKEFEGMLSIARDVAGRIELAPKAKPPGRKAPNTTVKAEPLIKGAAAGHKKRAKPPMRKTARAYALGMVTEADRHGSDQVSAKDDAASVRDILVTGHTSKGEPTKEFQPGEKYRLRFAVGAPSDENLAAGDTKVTDVPKGGLKTRWVVTAGEVEFLATTSIKKIERVGEAWVATFDLLIPETGNSETKELAIVPGVKAGSAQITIYAVSAQGMCETYREIHVNLRGEAKIESDVTAKCIFHTHLRSTHEWTTPPEHIEVAISKGVAKVVTKRKNKKLYNFKEAFTAVDNRLAGPIDNVRRALEKFREKHQDYLDALDHVDMGNRLMQTNEWQPYFARADGWSPLADQAEDAHRVSFDAVVKSKEWKDLAHAGHALFLACFDKGSKLRDLMGKLKPGSRIDFIWTSRGGAGWVSHVPWALMYLDPVDVQGKKFADPERFLGLRYRLSARAWPVDNGSAVLGGLDTVNTVNLLYWGDKIDDDVAVEAGWQAAEYKQRQRSYLVPDRTKPDFKNQVITAIDAPGPSPVGVLYFYCHCNVGNGAQPHLRFGNTSRTEDILAPEELSQAEIADGPLVFANACTTAQADAHMTSMLEASFFERGIRGFIGTETKVPIKLASKFAWLYFKFLYRIVDREPMAAGEALTQARLFLWTQYKNVGGLFYSMTNQYELYIASEAEVQAMGKLKGGDDGI